MKPQTVQIHGRRCTLNGGGSMGNYRVTSPAGAVLAQAPSRFLAVAKAAQALREQCA